MRHALPLYLGSILTGTLLLSGAAAWYATISAGSIGQILLALILALLPASTAALHIINWLVTQIVPPRNLPQLEFQKGIPPEFSTLVVIPSLLRNENELQSLLKQVENHFIGNADPNIHFALLTDFVDAPQKELPGEQQLIEQAKYEIKRLNNQYGSETCQPFLLLHRERAWNPGENCWMGWERKRGKLEELNHLLLSQESGSFVVQFGDLGILPGIRYIITTDADTVLPRDSAAHLIGTLAHPLNQAEFDPASGKVVAGYTVLQPRVQVQPAVANRSEFTRRFSGDVTLDLYSRAVSDIYQDLFEEGNYVGKGIYDLVAFERCLDKRVPENSILSHDLFEGLHGRCGLVTDITLFEDYPPQYLAYMHRLHRWVRGDWQLLPWLMPTVPVRASRNIPNSLSLLNRWKIIDNLRRSLVSSAIVMLILCGWFLLPGSSLPWVTMALSVYILRFLTALLSNLRSRKPNDPPDITAQPLRKIASRQALDVILLPHKALVELDAILATLVRLAITRKHLLQWVTAAHTVYFFGRELKIATAWREMVTAPLLALAILLGMITWQHSSLLIASPLLLSWLVSPYIAVRISRLIYHAPASPKPEQEHALRMLARTTWLFFEHFVGPEDHWLPPDHFQEEPHGLVAHRTSPTNIGLLLVSTLAAYDMGYIGVQELAQRIRYTYETLDLLERARGHLLNWYDTHSLAPLPPRYISTVDNGNLAACLLIVREGLRELRKRPVVKWGGLVDTLDMLLATLEETRIGNSTDELHAAILDLREQASDLNKVQRYAPHVLVTMFRESQEKIEGLLIKLVETSAELDQGKLNRLSTWVDRARSHLGGIEYDLQTLAPWSVSLINTPYILEQADLEPELASAWNELQALFAIKPALADTPLLCTHGLDILLRIKNLLPSQDTQARAWCQSFADELGDAHQSILRLLNDLQALEDKSEALFRSLDFRFLFDQQRQVFHIGFNVESGRLDPNYYDLLASEARIASLVAISKGEAPQSHWTHLARPLTMVGNTRTLLSWSGTMFEYLMPSLFLKNYPDTLLAQSCQAAVEHQIAYGISKNVPWGISESSFYYFDAAQVYQYRAFGAPGLGFKRGLDEDLVIAPYASLIALPFAPQAVIHNMSRLREYDMCGLYGFYESLDFTASRLSAGQEYAQVRSYMAHHQGMILLALDNYLFGNKLVSRFHADPRIKNVELLLQEQTPLRIETENPHQQGGGISASSRSVVALDPWPASPAAPYPQVHSLSNGNYSLLISATGSGYSRWGSLDLTRWRADTTLDNWGAWLYLRDEESLHLWSATSQPVVAHPDSQKVDFYPHLAEFERRDGDISIRLNISVAADDDVEIRRIVLTNHGEQPRLLSLTSYAEVILAAQDVDRRHPAFNRLFIESEYVKDGQILLFHRRPRSPKEKTVYLAHFVTLKNIEDARLTGFETDRFRFLGNCGSPRAPAALLGQGALTGAIGATLDPIFAMQTQVNLLPYESIRLAYITLAAPSRQEALDLAGRYKQWRSLRSAFNTCAHETENEMARFNLISQDLERIQKLLSALLYPSLALRADPAILAANTLGQPSLWPFSISGDYPILLARITQETGLQLLSELLQAHTYWRRRGLMIDLIWGFERIDRAFDRRGRGHTDNPDSSSPSA